MNILSPEARAAVISSLVEGNSIRSTSRITGRSQNTISKLLLEVGAVCIAHHRALVKNLDTTRAECDEIWSYIGCKRGNMSKAKRRETGMGDSWTWVGLDASSKLAISWVVGGKDVQTAMTFCRDLASRLKSRIQLTTDGNRLYVNAVEAAFGWNGVDYAMLQKLYGKPLSDEARYSPPACIGTMKEWIMGEPTESLVSTSYVERSNLSMRMGCRRFTRLTNAFSKKFEHHAAAVALYFAHYNWCRPHLTLNKLHGGVHWTPAMAAGLTNRVWRVSDLIALLEPQAVAA